MAIKLDPIDRDILECLQEAARISNVDLAERVGLSPAPCLRRVAALEEAGVIQKYVALIDAERMNLGVTVFVQISLDLQADDRLDQFEKAIVERPEVLECYVMTGDADYLLKVVVPDVGEYEHFLRTALARIESVARTRSSFALKQVKYSTALPIPARSVPDARPRQERKIRKRTGSNDHSRSSRR